MAEVEATEAEEVSAIWVVAEEASMAVVAATEEVSAATMVGIAVELMEAAITVARPLVVTRAEGDTAERTQAAAPLHPDRGHGKAVAQRAAPLPAGTDLPETTALQATPTQ
jgi:hypothetical protein